MFLHTVLLADERLPSSIWLPVTNLAGSYDHNVEIVYSR